MIPCFIFHCKRTLSGVSVPARGQLRCTNKASCQAYPLSATRCALAPISSLTVSNFRSDSPRRHTVDGSHEREARSSLTGMDPRGWTLPLSPVPEGSRNPSRNPSQAHPADDAEDPGASVRRAGPFVTLPPTPISHVEPAPASIADGPAGLAEPPPAFRNIPAAAGVDPGAPGLIWVEGRKKLTPTTALHDEQFLNDTAAALGADEASIARWAQENNVEVARTPFLDTAEAQLLLRRTSKRGGVGRGSRRYIGMIYRKGAARWCMQLWYRRRTHTLSLQYEDPLLCARARDRLMLHLRGVEVRIVGWMGAWRGRRQVQSDAISGVSGVVKVVRILHRVLSPLGALMPILSLSSFPPLPP